jgi:diguanylate cyclase (GGDEF)-like protein
MAYDDLVEQGLQAGRKGDRQGARDYLHQALRMLPADRARESSSLLCWIGGTYQIDGDEEAALECLDAALAIAEANNDVGARGNALNLRAIVDCHASRLDELTGLPLRRAFLERARDALRAQLPVSLLVIDVDHFKLVNDTFGHRAGDDSLRDIAHMLRTHLRSTDFLGRYAGDEFVAILPNTSADDAMKVGHGLRRAVHGIAMTRNVPLSQTISVGVATVTERGTSPDQLFDFADLALYEAKRRGRDIVVHHDETSPQVTPITAEPGRLT